MQAPTNERQSLWTAMAADRAPDHRSLSDDLTVDVAIIGGGIVGLTAAELLRRHGKSVAVLEARRIGRQVTGRSTAKITSQHNLLYEKLIRNFGEQGARTYGEANQAAIERIADFAGEIGSECAFERKAAYAYSRTEDGVAQIEREVEAARRLGLPATFVREAALPFPIAGAIRFDGQAQFDPCEYLLGMARSVADGGKIFENTRATSVEEGDPCSVKTDGGATVRARDVIVATHMPLGKTGMFFAKAFPFSHPMMAARVDPARAPDDMFISTGQPSHSIRSARYDDATYVVAVGGTYKSGHGGEEAGAVDDLERFLREEFGVTSIEYRWTNQDYSPMDGVPLIGRTSPGSEHLFAATGFNAWGITNGTVAGMILSDLIAGRPNPWAAFFDANRIKPVAGGPGFMKGNLEAAAHLVGDRLKGRPNSPDTLAPGEAAVFRLDGEQVAVHRDDQGVLHTCSAVCPHMGCILGWNATERSWDCPCHGSRFEYDGALIHGPATSPLERKR